MRIDIARPARDFLGVSPPPTAPIPTGVRTLDSGLGGLPRGAILEVRGAHAAGKTALVTGLLESLAHQVSGAVVDLTGEMPRVPGTLYARADGGEHALSIVRTLLKSGIDLIVVDPARALGDAAGRAMLLWTLPALHAQVVQTGACLVLVDTGLDSHKAPALFHIDAALELEDGRLRIRRGSPRCDPLQSGPAPRAPS